jgi:hypothetical protein
MGKALSFVGAPGRQEVLNISLLEFEVNLTRHFVALFLCDDPSVLEGKPCSLGVVE